MRLRNRSRAKRPSDLRLVSLKYAGRCQSCGKRLRSGLRAYWSRSSKKVWCFGCIRGKRAPARFELGDDSGNSRSSATGTCISHANASKPTDHRELSPWQQLCTYAQRCIEAEAAKSLVPYVKENALWFLHSGEEKLVVGQSDSTNPPSGFPDSPGSRARSIIYGWPTVVVTDRDHAAKVAPLFAVPIELEPGPDDRRLLHATMEPEFNLAITASGIFDPSVTEDIRDLLSHGLPFGDPDAFAELAIRTAELLGLRVLSDLDTEILQSSIDRQQGVYNAAVSVLAEWSAYTGTLREELRLLRKRKDWKMTAAAHLVSGGFSREPVTRPPERPACRTARVQPFAGGNAQASPDGAHHGRHRTAWHRQDAARRKRGDKFVARRGQGAGDINQ